MSLAASELQGPLKPARRPQAGGSGHELCTLAAAVAAAHGAAMGAAATGKRQIPHRAGDAFVECVGGIVARQRAKRRDGCHSCLSNDSAPPKHAQRPPLTCPTCAGRNRRVRHSCPLRLPDISIKAPAREAFFGSGGGYGCNCIRPKRRRAAREAQSRAHDPPRRPCLLVASAGELGYG